MHGRVPKGGRGWQRGLNFDHKNETDVRHVAAFCVTSATRIQPLPLPQLQLQVQVQVQVGVRVRVGGTAWASVAVQHHLQFQFHFQSHNKKLIVLMEIYGKKRGRQRGLATVGVFGFPHTISRLFLTLSLSLYR